MAKKKISKDKPVHPYSRKAQQLRRQLCKPEKVRKLNPLKELLLSKFRIFKTWLDKENKSFLTNSDIDQVLAEYFDLKSSNIFTSNPSLENEIKLFENGHGIEIPKVTCAKLCKRLLNLSIVDWSCIETLDLMKYYKPL
jgi:hypothetical protein